MFVAIAPDTLVSILHVLTPNSLILVIVLQHGETGRSMAATVQTTPHLTSLRDLVGQDLMCWVGDLRSTKSFRALRDSPSCWVTAITVSAEMSLFLRDLPTSPCLKHHVPPLLSD